MNSGIASQSDRATAKTVSTIYGPYMEANYDGL